MASTVKNNLLEVLVLEEGRRLVVYDDATGKIIGPGSVVVGHPTIGCGRALDTKGISDGEVSFLLNNDISEVEALALYSFPWYKGLSTNRQVVICALIFQLGLNGVKGFVKMCAAISAGNFKEAARQLLDSLFAKQTPGRAARMAKMLEMDLPYSAVAK